MRKFPLPRRRPIAQVEPRPSSLARPVRPLRLSSALLSVCVFNPRCVRLSCSPATCFLPSSAGPGPRSTRARRRPRPLSSLSGRQCRVLWVRCNPSTRQLPRDERWPYRLCVALPNKAAVMSIDHPGLRPGSTFDVRQVALPAVLGLPICEVGAVILPPQEVGERDKELLLTMLSAQALGRGPCSLVTRHPGCGSGRVRLCTRDTVLE